MDWWKAFDTKKQYTFHIYLKLKSRWISQCLFHWELRDITQIKTNDSQSSDLWLTIMGGIK